MGIDADFDKINIRLIDHNLPEITMGQYLIIFYCSEKQHQEFVRQKMEILQHIRKGLDGIGNDK